jgi:glycosyltransferase involved in cell wall biosynthesis
VSPGPEGGLALLHWTWPPTTGGVETHVSDLARFLVGLGARVTVITGEARPERVEGGEVVHLPELDLGRVRAEPGLRAPDAARRYRAALQRIIESRRVTVVHGHNLHHFSPGPAIALDDLRVTHGLRLFHTFHETWPDVLASNPVYAGWDGNYAVSAHVQRQCESLLGFVPSLARLGVDLARFRPVKRSSHGPLRILHPARVLPWKGVHLSVAMLALLRDRGIQASLVITDTQRIADWNGELDEYRRQVVDLAIERRVLDRIEFVSPRLDEMPALYASADVVVYPTVGEEPYGLVPLEAMSCARPVVASRSGGIVETVVDGVTGFLVERHDVHALADRVEALARDPELRRRMGAEGRRRVEDEFDGRAYAATMLARYRTAAPAGDRASA